MKLHRVSGFILQNLFSINSGETNSSCSDQRVNTPDLHKSMSLCTASAQLKRWSNPQTGESVGPGPEAEPGPEHASFRQEEFYWVKNSFKLIKAWFEPSHINLNWWRPTAASARPPEDQLDLLVAEPRDLNSRLVSLCRSILPENDKRSGSSLL